MARSGIPRRSKAPRFGDEGRGRRGAASGVSPEGKARAAKRPLGARETEDSRIATNSTRVTNAADLAKQGRRLNAAEVSGSGRRPEDIPVYVEHIRRGEAELPKAGAMRGVARTSRWPGREGEPPRR